MNLLAFILVLAAGVIGAIVVGITWKQKGTPAFLLGLAVALLSAGIVVQEVLIDWSRTVHS